MVRFRINYNNELIVPLFLNTGNDCDVTDMQFNDDCEFIVTLSDGGTRNLGQIIGEDGTIYKPYVEKDEQNVFTFHLSDMERKGKCD